MRRPIAALLACIALVAAGLAAVFVVGGFGRMTPSSTPSTSPKPSTSSASPASSAAAGLSAGRCWAYTQAGDSTAQVQSEAQVLAAAPCDGDSWVLDWRYLEPTVGQYIWQLVDAAIADSMATGRPVFLRVLAGINSPAWVGSVAQTQAIPASTYSPAGVMPVPWDPGFLKAWEQFIAAFGARYDGNPHIALIETAGTGVYGESYLPGGASLWTAAGYTEAGYMSAIEQIVQSYLAAFPHTAVAVDASIGVVGAQSIMAPLVSWVEANYPTRVYLQQNGLSGGTTPGQQAVQRAQLFGLQMVGPSTQSRTGSLCAAFDVALEDGAAYLEVYYSDVIDPANAAALRYLEAGDPSAPC